MVGVEYDYITDNNWFLPENVFCMQSQNRSQRRRCKTRINNPFKSNLISIPSLYSLWSSIPLFNSILYISVESLIALKFKCKCLFGSFIGKSGWGICQFLRIYQKRYNLLRERSYTYTHNTFSPFVIVPQNSCHSGGFEMVGWPKAGLVENLKGGEVKTSVEPPSSLSSTTEMKTSAKLRHAPQPEMWKQLQPEEGKNALISRHVLNCLISDLLATTARNVKPKKWTLYFLVHFEILHLVLLFLSAPRKSCVQCKAAEKISIFISSELLWLSDCL